MRAGVVGGTVIFIARSALAQAPAAPPSAGPPPTQVYPTVAPTPVPVQPPPQVLPPDNRQPPSGAYHHNGFYTRLSLGGAYTSIWGDGPEGAASISGPGVGLALSIGGTPFEGFVIAGTIYGANGHGRFKGGPRDLESSAKDSAYAFAPLFGVVADWFFDPRAGWHGGGGFGVGGFGAHETAEAESADGVTFAGTLFGGYDHFIGPEYSLGFMFAGTLAAPAAAKLDKTPTGYRFTTASFSLFATLLFH